MDITWKYASPVSERQINNVEKIWGFTVPNCLKEIIKIGNNGFPSKNKFDAKDTKEHVIKTLLSYNENDIENVFTAFAALKESDIDKIFPFANDPAGNLICMNGSEVVLWNHETGTTEKVADSVNDFFEHLY